MALERRFILIPTATNLLNLVSQNVSDNLRRRQDANIEFASLYQLAKTVYQNTGEIIISRTEIEDPSDKDSEELNT